MSCAARVAFLAWSGSSSGAFQNAMMQSPIYLSMVPCASVMISLIGEVKLFIRCVSSCGVSPSDIVVKPRMSQNITVSVLASPPR